MEVDINKINDRIIEEDDRITSYLKGQMSDKEEKTFLKELEENPDLKERAITMARLVKGLKQVGSAQDKGTIDALFASNRQTVENAAKNAIQTDSSAAKVTFMRKPAAWLSIAASLIFVVWLSIDYNNYRNITGLGDEYGNSSFTTEIVSRGSAKGAETQSGAEKKLERLFGDVKNNTNLDEAIHELSLCWELSTMETYNDYTEYSAEIGWNLAIAYLKDNDKKAALAVLAKMATLYDANDVTGKQVRELQQKIENL